MVKMSGNYRKSQVSRRKLPLQGSRYSHMTWLEKHAWERNPISDQVFKFLQQTMGREMVSQCVYTANSEMMIVQHGEKVSEKSTADPRVSPNKHMAAESSAAVLSRELDGTWSSENLQPAHPQEIASGDTELRWAGINSMQAVAHAGSVNESARSSPDLHAAKQSGEAGPSTESSLSDENDSETEIANPRRHVETIHKATQVGNEMSTAVNGFLHPPRSIKDHETERQPLTWTELIGLALLNAKDNRMKAPQIYEWAVLHFPSFFKSHESSTSSISAVLSMKHQFIKVDRPLTDQSKTLYWGIRPGAESEFDKIAPSLRIAPLAAPANQSALNDGDYRKVNSLKEKPAATQSAAVDATHVDSNQESAATAQPGNVYSDGPYRVDNNWRGCYTIVHSTPGLKKWSELPSVDSTRVKGRSYRVRDWIRIPSSSAKPFKKLQRRDADEMIARIREIKVLQDGSHMLAALLFVSKQEAEALGCNKVEEWPENRSYVQTAFLQLIPGDVVRGKLGLEEIEQTTSKRIFDGWKSRLTLRSRDYSEVAWALFEREAERKGKAAPNTDPKGVVSEHRLPTLLHSTKNARRPGQFAAETNHETENVIESVEALDSEKDEGLGEVRDGMQLDGPNDVSSRQPPSGAIPGQSGAHAGVGLIESSERAVEGRVTCLGNQLLKDKAWHFMGNIPGFTVCERCFDDLVSPSLNAEGYIRAAFPYRFLRSPETVYGYRSCQLSDQVMRGTWHHAVENGDFRHFMRQAREIQIPEDGSFAQSSATGIDIPPAGEPVGQWRIAPSEQPPDARNGATFTSTAAAGPKLPDDETLSRLLDSELQHAETSTRDLLAAWPKDDPENPNWDDLAKTKEIKERARRKATFGKTITLDRKHRGNSHVEVDRLPPAERERRSATHGSEKYPPLHDHGAQTIPTEQILARNVSHTAELFPTLEELLGVPENISPTVHQDRLAFSVSQRWASNARLAKYNIYKVGGNSVG
ncbi:hypothetical protein W97_02034 [Coniosporium apollinis CBS 100218]|uniref:Fork-head domain-containing protein n=1 Tax=Coniosporium apollinis (strain CBS 100218) TaxID=1168221 RepID=R7YLV7_CONA1|nr:uncharacterized protein W97_02034 [Coniosporium apollinis CBS 100218]EON62809.1 hypothetical protein W97_02034 [Coniosporium apollinis CBS 100218]